VASPPGRVLVFAVSLLLVASIAAGTLHGCDSEHESRANCVLCACTNAPAVVGDSQPLAPPVVGSQPVLNAHDAIPSNPQWALRLSSRAPPLTANA
jgi:hypothetical protein